ncbi:hypothetical protein PHJA_001242600 [Phtheirospermum japonicum]|uniref:Uncharacterized protein n=1 Tax=Phtheirospermum japonicum TaxID=374723 RepID=A0A830BW54_9LAMI|nr:hypothetical protein PHJA_001242600 [Phtheirospermum japonicum]
MVYEVKGDDVVCMIKNSSMLVGPLYTLHVSQIRIDLPTLTEKDKEEMGAELVHHQEYNKVYSIIFRSRAATCQELGTELQKRPN